jgi:hypothetical protein
MEAIDGIEVTYSGSQETAEDSENETKKTSGKRKRESERKEEPKEDVNEILRDIIRRVLFFPDAYVRYSWNYQSLLTVYRLLLINLAIHGCARRIVFRH